MKKIIIGVILFFCFIIPVKADLTSSQENDVAFFAEHFILEGSKRIGSDGFSIFAYMQGQARIDGFQSKLYKVGYDYKRINYVNAYKWTFDCASYAAFVYYKTLGLVLTKYQTNQIDSYSGLKINSATANPYEVKDYVADADKNKHFYYIFKDVQVTNLDYSKLKKGDLVIIVGSHIMIYIGDGEIAHASSSAITKSNLGLEVVDLKNKYPDKKVRVVRIKNGIINSEKQANMTITWPDNQQVINFRTLQAVNDKPKIIYTKSSNDWAKEIVVNVQLSDQDGLESYVFNDKTNKISGKSYNFKQVIKKNGSYIVTVRDKLGNIKDLTININNVDNTAPKILAISMSSERDYTVLKVNAIDDESGLDNYSYSYNKGETWTNEAIYNVYQSGEYEVYVKDKVGNVAMLKADVTVNKSNINDNNNDNQIIQPLVAYINEVIMGDIVDGKQKIIVLIINKDMVDNQIIITKNNIKPGIYDNWQIVKDNIYITYLDNGEHYIWLKDGSGNINEAYPITIQFEDEIENNNALENEVKEKKQLRLIGYLVCGIILFGLGCLLIIRKNKRKMFN